MLELHIDQSDEKLIVTLTELVTLDEPFFLFRFKHVETKQVVSFVKGPNDDESDYPYRYNQYSIDTAIVFAEQPAGEWHYEVYEQESADNTDPDLATGLIESGRMLLYRASEFEYTMYNQSSTFKTYNG